MPFQRRAIGFRGMAVLDKPRHKRRPVLNFAGVFGFRQLDDPKGRIFPPGRAPHEAIAPGVGDKNDGDAIPPHFQNPWQHLFPGVRVVFLQAREQAAVRNIWQVRNNSPASLQLRFRLVN